VVLATPQAASTYGDSGRVLLDCAGITGLDTVGEAAGGYSNVHNRLRRFLAKLEKIFDCAVFPRV